MPLSVPAQEFIAGGLAGLAAVLVGQPLDTVRVRQQAASGSSGGGGRAAPRASALATARSLVARGGIGALWKGVGYPAATIAGQSALVFQVYGASCRSLEEYRAGVSTVLGGSTASSTLCQGANADADATSTPPPTPPALSLADTFLAGCVAGGVQCGVIVPVDALKLRAQLSEETRRGQRLNLAAALRAAGGLRGLYRGAAVTAARDVPSHGLYFGLYEWAQRALGGREGSSDSAAPPFFSPSTATLIAGGGAGGVSWLTVYPLDVIKTRVQAVAVAAAGSGSGHGAHHHHHTFLTAARAGGLWAGAPATVGRAVLINAVLWWTYERMMVVLEE